MKKFISPLASFFLVTAALVTVSHAQVSPVKVRVETSSKSDTDKAGSSQSRQLTITVENGSAEQKDLKVKYVFFGRDVASKDIVTIGEGEAPVSVKPHGIEKVQSTEVKASVSEPKPVKGKKVDPSGQKIVGYGVQVLNGETVVAESFDPASMKASFGKVPAVTPAEKKK